MKPRQYRVKGWRGTFSGYPCFVLGNSPCILKCDLDTLSPFFTIGVNRIYKLFDPTILLWQDESLELEFDQIKAIKFCRDTLDLPSSSGVHKYYHFHLVLYELLFNHYKTHVLHGTGNTGSLAVQLAIGMGCKPIILLGMDCKRDEGNDDFHGKNEFWGDRTLEFCRNAMEKLNKECPVDLIVCNNNEDLNNIVQKHKRFERGRTFYDKMLLG